MPQAIQAESTFGKKNILWVFLSGAMALTFAVTLFLPDTGSGSSTITLYSAMLWCGIFSCTLFRYLNGNGWVGFFIGSVVGMFLQILSQLMH